MLFQQNSDGSEINEAKKRFRQFLVTRGNTSKLFNFLPKTLDQMSFFILPPVAFALFTIGFTAWDVGYGSHGFEPVHKILAVVPFVGVDYGSFQRKSTQKRRRIFDIRFISGG